MDIEIAKSLHNKVMGVLLAREGIGEFNDEDIASLKQTSLIDMLTANAVMTDYKEVLPEGGTRNYIVTTEEAIAQLYCRLHDHNFQTTSDLEDACTALNDYREAHNGHGILVDGYGNCSFVELNHDGDGAAETLLESNSASGLLSQVNVLANDLAAAS